MPAYEGAMRFEKGYPHGQYPVKLMIDDESWLLVRHEAESLRDELDALLNPQEHVVQVKVLGEKNTTVPYAFLDPTGELQIGDLVRVPFGHANALKVGSVCGTGRQGYSGPLKSVLARFTAEEL